MNVGQDLGPYRILAKLGEGGMGEVYKARHAALDRFVAIKILPPSVAADLEARDRFEREAKAVAALSHPNILAIHDFGVDGTVAYAVTELLEGTTLRGRLNDGALPRRQALDIAAQVANGLAASHDAGLVHRDIKPENIFLTPSGLVKILDFGLARRTGDVTPLGSNSQTVMKTNPGMVMGTVGYMSPEQVRGEELDSRSDIFSLGCVIFEMVSGGRAFERPTAVETLTAVLREDPPDLTRTSEAVPRALDQLIHHCLEKPRAQRFQSARDLAFALKALSGSTTSGSIPQVSAVAKLRRRWALVAAAVVLVAFGAALGRVLWTTAAPSARATADLVQFSLEMPASTSLYPFDTKGIAISPDGTIIAFVAEDARGKASLYLRSVSTMDVKPLAGTDDASYPFWAPDSHQLGFFANHKLNRLDIMGGPTVALCDAESGRGGAWNRDGVIVFAPNLSSGLFRIAAGGGRPEPVTSVRQDQPRQRWPSFLPDGQRFLYIASSDLFAGSLNGKPDKQILTNISNAVFAPPDRLVFSRGTVLMSQRFDPDALVLQGEAVPLPFGNVAYMESKRLGILSASETGTLIFLPAPDNTSRVVWVDRGGREDREIGEAGPYDDAELSPDGKHVAVVRSRADGSDIWFIDTADGHLSRFTFRPGFLGFPRWSRDSKQLAFFMQIGGVGHVCTKSLDGTERCPVMSAPTWQIPMDFSADGGTLLTFVQTPTAAGDIYTMSLGAKPTLTPLVATPFDEGAATFSPDGKWIAYQSNASMRTEVYLRRSTPSNEQWQISTTGGENPVWSADGRELFYHSSGTIMHVAIRGGASPNAGTPAPLFRIPSGGVAPRFTGNVSRHVISGVRSDSQRFLFRLGSGQPMPSIHVVMNWQKALR